MKRILLGLGSNSDFRGMSSLQILKNACRDLASFLENVKFSSVYKTKAMYVTDQNDFYNMVAFGFMPDSTNPYELLDTIHQVETKYGRDRAKEIRFGPRSLDIDIELFGDEEIHTEILEIPHPRMEERAFVLVPATEVLKKSADVITRDKYLKCLKKLKKEKKVSDVKRIISARKFLS